MTEYPCYRLRVFDAMPRGEWITTAKLTELTFPDMNEREKQALVGKVYRSLVRLHKWGEIEKIGDKGEGVLWRRGP